MNSLFDRLNLTPQERRLMVGIGIVLFIVLNVWLVLPHFGDWGRIQTKRTQAELTLERYKKEIAKVPSYQRKLQELQLVTPGVVASEQELDLVRTIDRLAIANQVFIQSGGPVPAGALQTNQFFQEEARRIQVATGTEGLVNFLVSLASTNSLIRVKDLSLTPGPTGTNLVGHMTLVASYQKQGAAPSANTAAAPGPAAATPKPTVASTPPRVSTNALRTERTAQGATNAPTFSRRPRTVPIPAPAAPQ